MESTPDEFFEKALEAAGGDNSVLDEILVFHGAVVRGVHECDIRMINILVKCTPDKKPFGLLKEYFRRKHLISNYERERLSSFFGNYVWELAIRGREDILEMSTSLSEDESIVSFFDQRRCTLFWREIHFPEIKSILQDEDLMNQLVLELTNYNPQR